MLSPQTGTDCWIFIEAPKREDGTGPFPAVLFLDGDDQFRFAVDAYRELRATGPVPPLVLVGVSYMKPANQRLRDYTPTPLATAPPIWRPASFSASGPTTPRR